MAVSLLANTAVASGDPRRALKYLELIPADRLGPEQLALSLVVKGALAEEEFRFADAAELYEQYVRRVVPQFRVSAPEFDAIKFKALHFAWLSSNPVILKRVGTSPEFCESSAKEAQALCHEIGFMQEIEAKLQKRALGFPDVQAWIVRTEKLHLSVRPSSGYPLDPARATLAWYHGLSDRMKLLLRAPVLGFVKSQIELRRTSLTSKAPNRADATLIQKHQKAVEHAVVEITAIASEDFPELQLTSLVLASQIYLDYTQVLAGLTYPVQLDDETRDLMRTAFREISTHIQGQASELRNRALEYVQGHLGFAEEFKVLLAVSNPGDSSSWSQVRESVRRYPSTAEGTKVIAQLPAGEILNLACHCDKWAGSSSSHLPSERNFRENWEKFYTSADAPRIQALLDFSRSRKLFDDDLQGTFQTLVYFRLGAQRLGWEYSANLVAFSPFRAVTAFQVYHSNETKKSLQSMIKVGDRAFRMISTSPWSGDILRAAAWSELALPVQFARMLESSSNDGLSREPATAGGVHVEKQ